ncbi:hypothetical protein PE36_00295 [Moritella sp. PE36]|uniref:hypothetical protein n=1 Tax=Moritella sp. PE36 TaxID=58051 RepID=UPI00015693D7|nr:hypothetical protein [Moritella sp. PE36]EDM66190.1 hypothetical protein PE36_00295 [Moritella sp. PE36]
MAIQRGTLNFSHYRGDAYKIQFTILDYDEQTDVYTPVDITNFDLLMQIRLTAQSATVIYEPVLEKTDAANGIFQWDIKPSISEALGVQSGVYDIQLRTQETDEDTEQVITFMSGSWTGQNDVSRVAVPKSVVVMSDMSVNMAIDKARKAKRGY